MPRLIPLLALVVLLGSSPALGQTSDSSALINEALDRQYRLELPTHTPLGQVMERITHDTGVPIRIEPAVFELLPWGTQSSVKVMISNQTLRQALSAMTQKLGLTWVLRDQEVEIRPSPPLRRLGRRATLEELGVLDLLASTPAALDNDRPTINELLAAVDAKLEAADSPFAVENRAFDRERGAMPVPVARNATLSEALESLQEATAATWYPWGKTILIEPKESLVRRQLQKRISARYNEEDLAQVLLELSQRSGVPFQIEPGAVQRVHPDFRRPRLILDNVPVQQALENISGVTGLGYVVNEKGVYLWNQNPNPAAGAGAGGAAHAAPREPAAGLLTLDNGMQVVVPQSQVPEDLRQYLQAKTAKKFEHIRQQMKEEGFKPTAPATQATTNTVDEDL